MQSVKELDYQPDIVAQSLRNNIGSVTLSPRADWRMPSDACNALWLKELDEIEAE